jgi:hypothetical protein
VVIVDVLVNQMRELKRVLACSIGHFVHSAADGEGDLLE